jgi:hypothetical protein
MVVHSDPLFQAWKVDLGIQGLLTSDLVEIGWLEHWPELRYDGRFPGLIGTAEIFDKTKISLNPKEFNAKLHNPQFRSYLASLSGEQQINYSKIFERDEIFTEDVLLGLTDIHHNVIDKLWASVGCTLSASDRQYAVEEFGHLLSLSREAARRDNVDQKDVLGIIRFYPRDHERAGAWVRFSITYIMKDCRLCSKISSQSRGHDADSWNGSMPRISQLNRERSGLRQYWESFSVGMMISWLALR